MFDFFKKMFSKKQLVEYNLNDTFGCLEQPPTDCPTFLERDVHTKFKNAIFSNNIIVVYGESRQGKTWTIERYCPNQLRIGCTANMTLEQIKKEMLSKLGVNILEIEHEIKEDSKDGGNVSVGIGAEMKIKAGVSAEIGRSETIKTSYLTVDMNLDTDFLEKIKGKIGNRYFVFDNFHYLEPGVQQSFCSLLKEFNYNNIKIIIVGVWKDASRITALAPDLLNRCEHIDIGSWSREELEEVAQKGEKALNIEIDKEALNSIIACSAGNIGIFKNILLKYCQYFGIYKTSKKHEELKDSEKLTKVMENVIQEALIPLRDRVKNLALPQREKKDSKHMRQKIVIAILKLVARTEISETHGGIPVQSVLDEISKACQEKSEPEIGSSNIIQELGCIHSREENRQTGKNFIPLFYYDKANRKILIIEPTIYEIKEYNMACLEDIINELENSKEEINTFQ